jgi:AcrR family transcriptional regulator
VTSRVLSCSVDFVLVPPKHGPAPQQRRSHATRARLVEAAIATLVEHGLAGASTPRIAQRAGVSQGALFKHFPTKDAILAAAVEAMLRDFVDDFIAQIARSWTPTGGAVPSAELVGPACAALWRIFRTREMRATFEVYVAARTDAAIAARLAPILERHRGAILREARRLFPVRPEHPDHDFEAAVDAIVYSMQGAALGLFAPNPDVEIEHLAFLERLARRELGLDAPRDPARDGTRRPTRPGRDS